MWAAAQLCRCAYPLRPAVSSRIFVPGPRNSITRQLVTPVRSGYSNKTGLLNSVRGFRIREVIKSNGVIARLCSSAPKQNTPKVVGYWLLGCSGMVFTAVVLGMVVGYLTLLYCIYYVVNVILSSTNGSK